MHLTGQLVMVLADGGSAAGVLQPQRVLLGGVMAVMSIALALTAIGSLVRRDRARLGPTTRRFCRALTVGASDRRLLNSLARLVGAASPASLLLSRGCFDTAVSRLRTTRTEAGRIAALRRRVFDDAAGCH